MKRYKGILVKLLIFVAIVIATDIVCGKFFRFLELKALSNSPYGMTLENTMWKIQSDVVIIGASEASHSIIPQILEDSLGMSVYNCGKDGCRFYIQNAMVNGVIDRYTPKLIIWSVGPDFLSTPSVEDKGNLSQINPFYSEKQYVKDALKTKSKYESVKLCSKAYLYNSRLFVYLYKMIMPDYEYEYGAYAPLRGTMSDSKLGNREKAWKNHLDVNVEREFLKTLSRCQSRGVNVVFVFVPRFEIEDHQNIQSYQRMIEIAEKYNITIIEDLYHCNDLMNSAYFKDHAHLNSIGAPIFTSLLSAELKQSLNICDKM